MTWRAFLVALCMPALISAQESASPLPALGGLDPVELCAGREVAGTADFSATSGRYLYHFASDSTRRLFQAAPDQYGIQFDGFCMRMGPLTGYGAPERYDVHEGRIYLFASDACRDRFRSNPERFVDRPDPLPAGLEADSVRVRLLLDKAVEAFGGAERLDSLKSFRVKLNIAQTHNDQVYRHTRETIVAFPASCRLIEDYGTAVYGWTLSGGRGWELDDSSRAVDPLVRDFMVRQVYRHPLVILKAWRRGEGRAIHQGPDSAGGIPVENIAFAHAGATTVLHISPESGQIVAASFRGRSGPGIGEVTREYSDFREVDGLLVPYGLTTRFEGEVAADVEVVCDYWKFDQPGDWESLK